MGRLEKDGDKVDAMLGKVVEVAHQPLGQRPVAQCVDAAQPPQADGLPAQVRAGSLNRELLRGGWRIGKDREVSSPGPLSGQKVRKRRGRKPQRDAPPVSFPTL